MARSERFVQMFLRGRGDESVSLGYVSIAVLLFLNAAASILVLRSKLFSAAQRNRQLALIWLVPAVGAVVCSVFVFSQPKAAFSASSFDPLYNPTDGQAPEGPGLGICGCGGGDSGGADGGGGD